jgi:hypothetical protein
MTELYYEQMPDNLTPGDIAAYQQILVEDTRRIEGMDGEAAVYGNRFNAEQYINNRPSKTAIFMAINKAKGTPASYPWSSGSATLRREGRAVIAS